MNNLHSGGCLTPEQLEAVGGVIDYRCKVTNTCGKSPQELLETYPVYNPKEGEYRQWGNIAVPWGNESVDPRWGVAVYRGDFSYREGDLVIVVADGGYRLELYEANSDIPVIAGAFDPLLWDKKCEIITSEQFGVKSYPELIELFEYYNPKLFFTSWDEYAAEWGDELEIPSSDVWNDAKIRKILFYKEGDHVIFDSVCGNYTCLYTAIQDMPAEEGLISDSFPPRLYWKRLYCVENGKEDLCRGRFKCKGINRKIVSLSDGFSDLICVGEPYVGR